ncbi:MAG TPA: GWxTD domain-containing protein [Acidobacteriota bacterium]|nr:GWxTD domain-containing protein [Acidobacteriota bacterium]
MPSFHFRHLQAGLIVAAALWVFRPGLVAAQAEFSGLPPPGAPTFELDFAAFRVGPDSVRVEVYYQVSNPRLSYLRRTRKPGDTASAGTTGDARAIGDSLGREYYVAAYEMTAVLAGDKDPQVATVSRRENYTLETYEETRSPTGYLLNILTMTVAPDEYELLVTLTDRVSGSSYTVRRDVELRHFRDDDWLFGGPEFLDPEATAPGDPVFEKAGRGIVPNVQRSFTGLNDRLAFYLEIDRDRAPEADRLVVDVYQRTRRKHFVDTVAVDPGTGIVPLIYRHALPGMTTGDARLRLQVLDPDGRQVTDHLEAYFWIDWTVSAMVEQDWEEAVDMLVHIADHGELKELREAPVNERERLFNAFWASRDPIPDTPENEWKQEYYRRIRFANLQFTNPFKRGWRTDCGTVYIRYGEPDEIERYPFERGQKPYQIWNYYSQNRKFVFVDTRGNGDYELQYPYDGLIR